MIRASGKRGFTLVELLVVVGMIALIAGAMTTSFSSAMQRARIQKATSEVKIITQAIQAYENYNKGKLKTIADWSEANNQNLDFLLGKGTASGSSEKLPVLLQATLTSGGILRDPWGSPYEVTIVPGTVGSPNVDSVQTGYYLPNFYRLKESERQ